MKVLTRFVTSAADPRHFPPPGAPEIAFLGRSNVGKSSLINSLVGSKIAKTSNTPGRTQTINFFEVRRHGKPKAEFVFADLPGYGYARVPKEITAKWSEFINPYLEKRPTLALCLSLVDVTIPPQQLDMQLLEWLRHANRPFPDRRHQGRSHLQQPASQLAAQALRAAAGRPGRRLFRSPPRRASGRTSCGALFASCRFGWKSPPRNRCPAHGTEG